MGATQASIGRGTKILVAPSDGGRVLPEATVFTTGADAAANATEIIVTMSPAITRNIPASANNPLYLNFIETNGTQHFVVVTAPISPTSTTLTVRALKSAIATGAIAIFPVLLARRENANLSDDPGSADINVFENDGYKDNMHTIKSRGLELAGFYSELDAGWNTCLQASNNLGEVYCKLQLPPPPGYNKGRIFEFFTGVKVPIEISAAEIIKSNISFMSRGTIYTTEPA